MVVFTCHGCNETLKKAQVEKHRFRCKRSHALCCIDCLKDFHGEEFQAHTKCISEDQKYGGQNYVAKENKGEVKQQKWFDTVQQAIDIVSSTDDYKLKQFLSRLRGYPNIPQKEAKFRNFVTNCVKERDTGLVARAWAAVGSAAADLKKKDAEKTAKSPELDKAEMKEAAAVKENEENIKVEDIPNQNDKHEERSELPEIETNAAVKPKKNKKQKKEKLEETTEIGAEPDVPKEQAPEAEPKISCDDALADQSKESDDVKPRKKKKSKKEKLDESEQITESSALPDIDATCDAKLDAKTSVINDKDVEPKIPRKKRKNKLEENAENHEAVNGDIVQKDVCNGDVLESETNIVCDKSDENAKRKKDKKRKRQSGDEVNTCQLPESEISSKDTCDDPSMKCEHDSQLQDHCENQSVAAEDEEVKPKKHKKQKKHRTEDN